MAMIMAVEARGDVCVYETVWTSLGSELEVLSDYVCESPVLLLSIQLGWLVCMHGLDNW